MADIIENAAFLDYRAVMAKQSIDEANQLIEDFKPYLKARVSKYSLRADGNQREELFSVALVAFYESIQKYDIDKGHFFPFANRVVRERIIDSIRSFYRYEGRTVPLEHVDDEYPSAQSAAIKEISMRSYGAQRRQELMLYEIEQLNEELNAWGIDMDTLCRHSPKHKRLLETYRMVVAKICQNQDIVQTIQLKHYFPMKSIAELTGLPQKTLERARTFILASLIIKLGDYEYLSDYIVDGGKIL